MELLKAEDSGEREGGKDHEERTAVNYAKGLRVLNLIAKGEELQQSDISVKQTTPKSSGLKSNYHLFWPPGWFI